MNENIECVIRLGHCEGHTDCAFISPQSLITCGVDSEVRIWPINGNQIEDYVESFPVSDPSYAVVSNSSNFFIACDSNCVKSYSLSDGDNETTVCRFETNATHLDISSDGKLLVASAADFTVKVVNLETNDQKCLSGHSAPVLSVALDPKLKYIASSSCDGSVRVWNIENQNCVNFWENCFPKSNDFDNSQTFSRICWQPIEGKFIAVPKMDRIDVYQRDNWNLFHTYRHEVLKQISIVCFSFDAKYLAVASNEGLIMIWETNDNKSSNSGPIAQYFHKIKKITSLKWNLKSSKHLIFCDIGGQFGLLTINNQSLTEDNQMNLSQEDMNDLFAEINDEDFAEESQEVNDLTNEPNIGLEKIEFNPKYRQQIEKRIQNNETNESIDNSDDIDSNDENNEFDIGAIKSRYESQIFGEVNDDFSNDKEDNRRPLSPQTHSEAKAETVIEAQSIRQEPFQPGSTPIHLENRFMVWNAVGIVRSIDSEEENSIEVEFHDTTYHHSIHLPNVHNYIIADLSNEAFALATNGDESATNGKLFCMLLNIWDATKEWQIDMPTNEFIDAIACSSNFIAVSTDRLFIRVFTIGGIQSHIFSLSGRVVCLSAYEHFLMIIYHSASGMPEEQSLSMYVLNLDHKSRVNHPVPNPTPVALSPKSLVSWAGFTDEGTPCVVDSEGVVRLYNKFLGNTWIPIASTKEQANGKSNNFFTIGLSEIQSQIRCIFCKGSRYPATIPKPTLTLLSLQIPICEVNTTKGKHEEEQIRHKILSKLLKKLSETGFDVDSNIEESNRSLISSSIKLFATALAADRESLAVEICNLMTSKIAVEGAIKYADKQNRRTLIQKLSEIAQQKLEEESNDNNEDQEEIYEEIQVTQMSVNLCKGLTNDENYELKPKSIRKVTTDSNEENDSDFNNESIHFSDDSNDSNLTSLKPKGIQKPKHSTENPFKIIQKTSKRENTHKRERDSEESDEETIPTGFDLFFSEMKQTIKDDNSDAEDEELRTIALHQFKQLDSLERKEWTRKSTRNKKIKKTNSENSDSNTINKINKITNFFNRN